MTASSVQAEDVDLYPDEIELIEDDSQEPDTDDIEEIRKYWDTHAITDFNSEPVPMDELPDKLTLDVMFSVHVEEENIYKIADLAKAEGVRTIPMAKKLLNRAISEAHAAKFGTSEPTERIRRWMERNSESGR